MPRPKKPIAASDAVLLDEGAITKVTDASRAMATIDGAAAEQSLRHSQTLQLIGGVNVAASIAESLTGATVRAFMKIRDEKRYVGLPYRGEDGALRAVTTLEEFCPQFLGISYDTMRERVNQLEALGDAGFDGAMRMGLTFKQFRALEGSDADARKKVAAALESGARAEVLNLVDELIEARREARRENLEKDKAIEAKDRVIDQKNKKLDELAEEQHQTPAWQRAFERATKTTSELHGEFQILAKKLADHAAAITDLEFDGIEKRVELNTLRAQVANHYYDAWQSLLEQSMGLVAGAVAEHVEPVLELARKQLPDEVKAKIFGEGK